MIPSIECGTIAQQRYRLSGQNRICQISVSDVDSIKPRNPDDRMTSSDESPAEVITDSRAFEVIAIGSNPFLCFYEISRDSVTAKVGSIAFSVAKSLYGAVKSLAGYVEVYI